MSDPGAFVYVVDDDASVREGVTCLIRSAGLMAKTFASAEEFLDSNHISKADCLILDVRLPGMSGFELHHRLIAGGIEVPVIFITAHGYDDRARSEAASDWTVAQLTKPFSEDELLDAVQAALKRKTGA